MIIVRDADKKDLLASCMSSKNSPKVKNSGASVIICSDMGFFTEMESSFRYSQMC